jgi:hypothetical protein
VGALVAAIPLKNAQTCLTSTIVAEPCPVHHQGPCPSVELPKEIELDLLDLELVVPPPQCAWWHFIQQRRLSAFPNNEFYKKHRSAFLCSLMQSFMDAYVDETPIKLDFYGGNYLKQLFKEMVKLRHERYANDDHFSYMDSMIPPELAHIPPERITRLRSVQVGPRVPCTCVVCVVCVVLAASAKHDKPFESHPHFGMKNVGGF